VLVVGFGCASYVEPEEAIEALLAALADAGLPADQVARVATIDKLRTHPAPVAVARELDAELLGYSPAQLDAVVVPTPSQYVRERMGTKSVAEAAALLAAGGGRLILPKQIRAGAVTVAVVETDAS
jgi:cobalamin biosynthesis protein CbiG